MNEWGGWQIDKVGEGLFYLFLVVHYGCVVQL
jgi:hypothetical protein